MHNEREHMPEEAAYLMAARKQMRQEEARVLMSPVKGLPPMT
jgi:hypothetical protein